MIFQAHKGVSTENPENTMPSFIAALGQGYKIIETDVSVTKDFHFVLLHDDTINRTARYQNGDIIPESIKIGDITYSDALSYDFGIWYAKKFKDTKIPLLEDVLEFAERNGIKIKIDNKYQRFTQEQKDRFFKLLKPYSSTASLTCSDIKELEIANRIFPEMHFHYDGETSADTLAQIGHIIPKERLTVWLPHKNADTSWVNIEFANKSLAELVKKYAALGLWILSDTAQLEEAKALGADIIETNGQLKPDMNKGLIADMHTHSEMSHDSLCKTEDMYKAQLQNGTSVFAVTDHFDTASFKDCDVFSPIRKSCEIVEELNKRHCNGNILSGVEISEGFWYPQEYEKVLSLADYDVIIGSVHLVRYADLTEAYSKIDFSKLSYKTIVRYIDTYFDDILTMLDTTDFDILAHLTCPLRYINGKYKVDLDLSQYSNKIEKILRRIIQKGIALEINTSSFDTLNNFMPPIEILTKYRRMGGYLITLGSDAHISANASSNFGKAIDEIKKIGFKHIYFYKKRSPYQITI